MFYICDKVCRRMIMKEGISWKSGYNGSWLGVTATISWISLFSYWPLSVWYLRFLRDSLCFIHWHWFYWLSDMREHCPGISINVMRRIWGSLRRKMRYWISSASRNIMRRSARIFIFIHVRPANRKFVFRRERVRSVLPARNARHLS